MNPLVEEEIHVDVPMNHYKSDVAMEGGIHSDTAARHSYFVMSKQLSNRRKADVKYLENLMAHPTWFTAFSMERPKDFHLSQAKHPVLKNIEDIQQFYRRSLAEAMCMTGKGYKYSQEFFASNSFPQKTLRNQQNPYFRFNNSTYEKTLYRGNIRNKIQSSNRYRTFSKKKPWFYGYNRIPETSCRSLFVPNQWAPQPSNVTEEIYEPQSNDNPKIYSTEKHSFGNIRNHNWSDFPENLPSFVDNPGGIGSNIKAIFGKVKNNLDVDYLGPPPCE
nr:uncharacterized protein LOC106682600 isoform X2 [Halyomorpha halys]